MFLFQYLKSKLSELRAILSSNFKVKLLYYPFLLVFMRKFPQKMLCLANYVSNIKTMPSSKSQVQNLPFNNTFFNEDVFLYPPPPNWRSTCLELFSRVLWSNVASNVQLAFCGPSGIAYIFSGHIFVFP